MRPDIKRIVLQLGFLFIALPDILEFFGLTAREPLLSLSPAFEQKVLDIRRHRAKTTSSELCNMLALHRKQKRMCKRGRGMAATLVRATRLSVLECQYQFRDERWNCTLGKYRKTILEEGIKETAFIYAISSAGLVHELARACAMGTLDRCTCDESKHLENTKTWRWGGCGDNLRFGLKFTRKLLRKARPPERDIRATVDEHNSGAGLRAVKDHANTTCKCHGVSGSCTVSTCWLQLSPFKKIGSVLKKKYEKSAKVIALPNQATGITELMKKAETSYSSFASPFSAFTSDIIPVKKTELCYIEDSPNFCRDSPYSPGTSGRSCDRSANCDSICCGRGYNVQKQRVVKSCKCVVIWCCEVKCKQCISEEEVYLCK